LAVLQSGAMIPERVPFVPVVSCKVCTSVYRHARFDEPSGAMDVARARMKHNPAKRGLGRVGLFCVSARCALIPSAW
ncbi:MAG: hypothetical protein EBY29_14885, partial [Planctomycetes bacterium]|nr:hypothetical protein [Planctomycetota bacterium]